MRHEQRADGSGQWAMGKMRWSIRKGQRAMIAAGIAVAVFAGAREFDVLWRYGRVDVWTHGCSKFSPKWAKVSPKAANFAPN